MPKQKTNEEFQQEIRDMVGNEYTFLDTYVNTSTKIKVKHNICGNTYKVTPNHFLRGSRCPYCSGKIKKTNDEFKKEVYDLVGKEYTFLDFYQGTHTKLKVKHNICGTIYEVRPHDFLRGTRCPRCFGTHKKTNDEFTQEVKNLVGDEYIFLEPYVNAFTKIKVKHNKCGKVYKVEPHSFLKGQGCPSCSVRAPKSVDQFTQEVFNLVGDEYTFLDDYVNNYTKLRVKHNKCGHIYKVRPYSFLEGYGCPYCKISQGEKLVGSILSSFTISYECQKTFDDLKDTKPLSYDFYIPDQSILIEYQGIQHYQPTEYFGGKSKFKLQQKHDQMKADYAKAHHYNLIAIPYTEDTFSKIKKYLIKHGLNK